MKLYLLGINHKKAEIQLREKFALSKETLCEALELLHRNRFLNESYLLSTCNRTEIYAVSEQPEEIFPQLEKILSEVSGLDLTPYREKFYYLRDQEAVVHLFQVAAGMDSLILGEPQILGQVKEAFLLAGQKGNTGVILNRLLNMALSVGKRVRSETELGVGAISVAYAAVELAQKIFKNLGRETALLIGAGETGELIARHLREKGIGKLYITNRTFGKAEFLAAELEGEAIPFENFLEVLSEVNIVVGAASAPDYLITRQQVKDIVQRRSLNPLLFVDIGVPRNFDPTINQLEAVFLHDIDALDRIVQRNLERRRLELPNAQKIVQEELQNFLDWKRSLEVKPTIISLRQKLEKIRQQELEKNKNRLSEEEYRKADLITRSIINKILHLPTVSLRKYSNGLPDGLLRIDVVREIFELEDEQ